MLRISNPLLGAPPLSREELEALPSGSTVVDDDNEVYLRLRWTVRPLGDGYACTFVSLGRPEAPSSAGYLWTAEALAVYNPRLCNLDAKVTP